MMKKWKRILGSALAVTTAAASVSGMSAGAVAFYSTSLEPPKGYTELDDKSFFGKGDKLQRCLYRLYRRESRIGKSVYF